MTEYECGCSEDMGPCESHFDVIVMRIGSAAYSADELALQFVRDAVGLGVELDADDAQFVARISGEAENTVYENNWEGSWLANHDDSDWLRDLLTDYVENKLSSLGFHYEWDDGYRIGKVSGPLFDDESED